MTCTNIFSSLESFYQPLVDFTIASSFYQSYGLIVVLLYSMTPSIVFIPNEAFYIPLMNTNGVSAEVIVILIGVGGSIGDSLIYFASYHGVKYFKKEEKMANKKVNKMLKHFHRHKSWIFLISPSVIGLGDFALVYAGVNKLHYSEFFHYLIAGNFIRAIWGIALVLGGFELFNQLCGI